MPSIYIPSTIMPSIYTPSTVRDQAIELEQTRYALMGGGRHIWSWGGGKANMKASASLHHIDRRWVRIYFHIPQKQECMVHNAWPVCEICFSPS